MAHGSYDPKATLISYNDVQLSGFGTDTFLNIEQREDAVTLAVGADGETAFSQSNDESAEITLTLLQTSNSNSVLDEFRHIEITSIPAPTGTLYIEDLNTGTIITCTNVRIMRAPNQEFGKEVAEREWTFLCGRLTQDIRGRAF